MSQLLRGFPGGSAGPNIQERIEIGQRQLIVELRQRIIDFMPRRTRAHIDVVGDPHTGVIIQKPGKKLDLRRSRWWVRDQRATSAAKGNDIAWASLVKRNAVGA